MTAYGKPLSLHIGQYADWMQKKAARKKVLAGVRARRRENYKRLRAKKAN